jgi:methyl-accepting chemotaxis protein
LKALTEGNLMDAKKDYEATQEDYYAARNQSIAAVLAGLLMAAGFGWYLVRGIIRPLRLAVQAADDVAAGKLDGKLPAAGNDETGQLLQSFSKMQGVLGQFQSAQTEMARQHEAGMIDFEMPAQELPGDYAAMARSTNELVRAHITLNSKVIDLALTYSEGRLDTAMDRLPGQKARISDAMDKVQGIMKAAAEAATFNLRIRNSLDSLPANVTVSNAEALLVHATPPAKALLKLIAGPGFDADAFYGNKSAPCLPMASRPLSLTVPLKPVPRWTWKLPGASCACKRVRCSTQRATPSGG